MTKQQEKVMQSQGFPSFQEAFYVKLMGTTSSSSTAASVSAEQSAEQISCSSADLSATADALVSRNFHWKVGGFCTKYVVIAIYVASLDSLFV